MNAPLPPTQTRSITPARAASALNQRPPRPWRRLSETAKLQVASVVADMVKRMATSAPKERRDVGDHDKSDERLTPARRAKLAYIYVRQSSVTQVKHHQESTELQYHLVDRAVDLGWPRERVQVIDEEFLASRVRVMPTGRGFKS